MGALVPAHGPAGYLWAVLRDDRGWNGPALPSVAFHYRPGRKGEYAAKILDGFNGTIQVDAYSRFTRAVAEAEMTRFLKADLTADRFSWSVDEDAVAKAQLFDGTLALITNTTDISPA